MTRFLVTDLEDCNKTLIEVLGRVDGVEQVIAEFVVTTPHRPTPLRYRVEQGWS